MGKPVKKQATGVSQAKESDIQLSICDYLAAKRHFFWRQNTAPLFREGRFFAMPKYSKVGVPDIIVIFNGKFIGLEVKRPNGKPSVGQKEFESDCIKAGGAYHLVCSIDDVIKIGL